MSNCIVKKLRDFNSTLDEAEQANYKLILGLAAGGLAPKFGEQYPTKRTEVFDVVGDCLAKLQPYSKRINDNGVAWIGRPEFMSDELLSSLQEEAKETRHSAIDNKDHFLGCGGKIANDLANSRILKDFVSEHAGDVLSTGIASYIFYDQEGQGIPPHVDTDIFSLNILLMLEHTRVGSSNSNLVLYPPKSHPERIDLNPGEIIVMFAGSITHGREVIANGENVTILTFGFHPLG